MWTQDDLMGATGGAMRAPFTATGVSIDTRTLQPGDLFVALRGEHGDGHAYVAEALARGLRPAPWWTVTCPAPPFWSTTRWTGCGRSAVTPGRDSRAAPWR